MDLRINAIIRWAQQHHAHKNPYKEVLKSITTSGTQYWDTGIKAQSGLNIKCRVTTASTIGDTTVFFGGWDSGPANRITLFQTDGAGHPRYDYGGYNPPASFAFSANTDYLIECKSNVFYVDGTAIATGTALTFEGSNNIYLGCLNNHGSAAFPASASYELFRIDGLVDMIPVLDWSGNPCFYDRVSHTMMYHEGTGTLTYERWGMTEVDYIQSSGSQYIDLGLSIGTSYKLKMNIMWPDASSHAPFFGGYDAGGSYSNMSFVGTYYTTTTAKGFYANTSSNMMFPVSSNTWYEICWNGLTELPTYNGTSFGTLSCISDYTPNVNAYLFTRNQGGTAGSCDTMAVKSFYCEDADGNVLRDYTPVVISNVAEIYDSVENKLATRTGTFTPGPFARPSGVNYHKDANNNEYWVVNGTLYASAGASGTGVMPNFSANLPQTLGITDTFTSVVMDSNMTTIGIRAFYGCTELIDVSLPTSLTKISNAAFIRCTKLTLSSIPSGVTSIGSYAFSVCTSLTTMTIPSSVTSIGDYAFSECRGLTTMTIPSSVTSIGSYVFYRCTALTTMTIPSSVTSIGDSAFNGCTALTTMTIPSSVTSIGNYAFNGCTALTTMTIPSSVTSIGNYAFDGCTELIDVSLPTSLTKISYAAFAGCTNLTLSSIPSGVTSIGDYAFYGCTALTTMTIPSSVTSIGDYAFYGCTALTTMTIPSSVTSIGNFAFTICTALTTMTIPSSVTSIGTKAFYYDGNLTTVTILGTTPATLGVSAFTSSATIYVPSGTLATYQSAWSDYASQIVESS